MEGPCRLVSAPLRAGAAPTVTDVAELVAVDAAARAGDGASGWALPLLTGDAWAQWHTEQSLAREGLDRISVGREGFAARLAQVEEEQRTQVLDLLSTAGLDPLLPGPGPDPGRDTAVDPAAAGATAFVALYEAGVISFSSRVVASCPRCASVMAPGDTEALPPGPDDRLVVLAVPVTSGGEPVEAETATPELLDGMSGLAVPPGHPAAGGEATLPLLGRAVPVVEDPSVSAPTLLVPGHDPAHWEAAGRHGLATPVVMAVDGTLTSGPWEGLARFAARHQAFDALDAAGAVAATRPAPPTTRRCLVCGTTLVDRLGEYWFLAAAPMGEAAAAAVESGAVAVSPPEAAVGLVEALGGLGEWCVSQQLWAGPPVPVGWCLDCRKPAVAVAGPGSCGACMGELRDDGSSLDPRFVAVCWVAGLARTAPVTLVAASAESAGWLAPALAVLCRLAGAEGVGVSVLPEPGSELLGRAEELLGART